MIHHPQMNKDMQRDPSAYKVRHLFFLLGLVFSMVSCGYSLEFKRIDDKAEDPITVFRRELRQLKADHRVSIFDLKKEQKNQVGKMQAGLTRMGKANETLGKNLIQMKRSLSEARTRLRQNSADTDERFAEMEIQHRLIHGRIEEEANRFKESAARGNNFTLKELEGFRKDLAVQKSGLARLRELDGFRKDLAAQKASLSQLKKKQTQASQALQTQIAGVQAKNVDIEETTDGQKKTLQAVSAQVSELIDKMLPAVNGLAARVDNLEWELEKLKNDVDIQSLHKRLRELTEAIDVQRQSLEMLGNTLASQVDKQGTLLQKALKDLQGLQSKTSATSE